jgi:hypothetical protein
MFFHSFFPQAISSHLIRRKRTSHLLQLPDLLCATHRLIGCIDALTHFHQTLNRIQTKIVSVLRSGCAVFDVGIAESAVQ